MLVLFCEKEKKKYLWVFNFNYINISNVQIYYIYFFKNEKSMLISCNPSLPLIFCPQPSLNLPAAESLNLWIICFQWDGLCIVFIQIRYHEILVMHFLFWFTTSVYDFFRCGSSNLVLVIPWQNCQMVNTIYKLKA